MAKSVGLRTEILVTLTLLLGAALLFGGVMMLHLMEKNLLEERVGQLRSLSQVLATVVVDDGAGSEETLLNEKLGLLEHLPENIHCNGWWLYDRNLVVVGSYAVEGVQPFSSAKLQMVKLSKEVQQKVTYTPILNFIDTSTAALHLILPVVAKGHFSGLLEINFSFSDIREKTLGLLRILILYIFLYGFILVLTGYYLIHKNIIRPARNLLVATEAVSEGNLEKRLPVAGPAEIAQLATAYNQMVDALRESYEETETHILSLEKTNQKLKQTSDELIRSEKMASVGQLSAGLAHELGNPLAALIGYLEILKGTVDSAKNQDIVERSLVEATRIDFLVRELLDFSRPDEGGVVDTVDLAVELSSAVQLLQNQGTLAEIDVVNKLPESLPTVQINRNKLQQVFVNILLNAAHACHSNGMVTLTGGTADAVWVSIEDNGVGIAAPDMNKIFNPFFTTKPPGEGTGLGLAMCQRIVQEAGGCIEVKSELAQGSVFKLVFLKNSWFWGYK